MAYAGGVTATEYRPTKDVAAVARRSLKAAQAAGRVPAELTIRVRSESASMYAGVAITVEGLASEFLFGETAGTGDAKFTTEARELSWAIRQEIGDALAWGDGRMRFTSVYFGGGLLAPPPLAPKVNDQASQARHVEYERTAEPEAEQSAQPSQTVYLAAVVELLASRRQPRTGEVATSYFNRGLDQATVVVSAALGHALGVPPRTQLDHEVADRVANLAQVETERAKDGDQR